MCVIFLDYLPPPESYSFEDILDFLVPSHRNAHLRLVHRQGYSIQVGVGRYLLPQVKLSGLVDLVAGEAVMLLNNYDDFRRERFEDAADTVEKVVLQIPW